MLTRIELNNFKSFDHLVLDFAPLAVLLGANGSGKSNVFDALHLLSLLAEDDVLTALGKLRGRPLDIFRRDGQGNPASSCTLTVDVLLPPMVKDGFGEEAPITTTRVRYELTLKHSTDASGSRVLQIEKETATPILRKDDAAVRRDFAVSATLEKRLFRYARKIPFLEPEETDKGIKHLLRQDARQGKKRPLLASNASALSTVNSVEFPHLLALRQELRAWRFLHLDPASLRKASDEFVRNDALAPDGGNLAAVLARIQRDTATKDAPKGRLADIDRDMRRVIPNFLDVSVVRDEYHREYQALARFKHGPPFPATIISDGTLRMLALFTALHDPAAKGTLFFEEPENGIHPTRLKALMRRLLDLTSPNALFDEEFYLESDDLRPLQCILNSHSPVVLGTLRHQADPTPVALHYFDSTALFSPGQEGTTLATRVRPVVFSQQQASLPGVGEGEAPPAEDAWPPVSEYEVQQFLSVDEGGA